MKVMEADFRSCYDDETVQRILCETNELEYCYESQVGTQTNDLIGKLHNVISETIEDRLLLLREFNIPKTNSFYLGMRKYMTSCAEMAIQDFFGGIRK
jgi:hypothetical protein